MFVRIQSITSATSAQSADPFKRKVRGRRVIENNPGNMSNGFQTLLEEVDSEKEGKQAS